MGSLLAALGEITGVPFSLLETAPPVGVAIDGTTGCLDVIMVVVGDRFLHLKNPDMSIILRDVAYFIQNGKHEVALNAVSTLDWDKGPAMMIELADPLSLDKIRKLTTGAR